MGDVAAVQPQVERVDAIASLKPKAIRAARWTLLGFAIGNVVRFVGNTLIMTRLLPPEAFGIMGTVNVVRRGIEMFADIGVGPCIIQHPRGTEDAFLQTAWTMQLIRGVVLWLAACALAWPVAWFYGKPELTLLLVVMGFASVIGGFSSTGMYVLGRRMEVGKLTLLGTTSHIFTVLVMIGVALVWPTVWAFVIGGLVGTCYRVVGSYVLMPSARMKLTWDREAGHQLLTFGSWILLSTALTYLGAHADRLILPKLFPFDLFGVFVAAYGISEMPKEIINRINAQVLMPAVANRNHLRRTDLRNRLIHNRRPLLYGVAVGVAVAVTLADQVILVLLSPKWAEAAWMLPILLAGVWFSVLASTLHSMLIGLGAPKWGTLGNFLKLVFVAVSLPIAHHYHGPLGAVIVIAVAAAPHYLAVAIGASRHGIGLWMQDLRHTVLYIALLATLLLLRYQLGFGSPFMLIT